MSDERDLKQEALELLQAGLEAVDPTRLTVEYLEQREEEIAPRGRLVLMAVGKAAGEMARGARTAFGSRIADGVGTPPPTNPVARGPRRSSSSPPVSVATTSYWLSSPAEARPSRRCRSPALPSTTWRRSLASSPTPAPTCWT